MNRLWIAEMPRADLMIFGPYNEEEARKVAETQAAGREILHLMEVTSPSVYEREVDPEA